MCNFVTYIFETQEDSMLAKKYLESSAPTLYKINSKDKNIENKYALELSGCYCNTVLIRGGKKKEKMDYSHEILLLKKKGWSDSKINRWLEEKSREKVKAKRIEDHTYLGKHEAEEWMKQVKEILKLVKSKKIEIIVHWFTNNPRKESFEIEEVFERNIVTCIADDFKGYNERDLIEFKK